MWCAACVPLLCGMRVMKHDVHSVLRRTGADPENSVRGGRKISWRAQCGSILTTHD